MKVKLIPCLFAAFAGILNLLDTIYVGDTDSIDVLAAFSSIAAVIYAIDEYDRSFK